MKKTMPALGFIETRGRVGAVEAADTALKSAEVKLVAFQKVSGGLVTVIITGEVAAVQAAVESAKIRARQLSRSVTTNVIPGPADEIIAMIEQISRGKRSATGKRRAKKKEGPG